LRSHVLGVCFDPVDPSVPASYWFSGSVVIHFRPDPGSLLDRFWSALGWVVPVPDRRWCNRFWVVGTEAHLQGETGLFSGWIQGQIQRINMVELDTDCLHG